MDRIGARFNRAEIKNFQNAELKQENSEAKTKGKTEIKRFDNTKSLIDRSGSVIAPPEEMQVDSATSETVTHEDGSYTVTEYDSNHNPIKSTDYDANGNIRSINTNEYNSDGKLVKSTFAHYSDGKIMDTFVKTFEYDSYGNCIKDTSVHYDNNGKVADSETHDYEYEGNQKIREAVHCYDANGQITLFTEDIYDSVGHKIKYTKTLYDSNGEVAENHVYTSEYDENGRCFRCTENHFDSNVSKHIVSVSQYDSQGRIIQTTRNISEFKDNEIISTQIIIKNEYDSQGRIIKTTTDTTEHDNGEVKQHTTVIVDRIYDSDDSNSYREDISTYVENFDENGILRSKVTTIESRDGSSLKIELTYDENGNLIRKKERDEDAKGNITITTTTYNEDGSVKSTRTMHKHKSDVTEQSEMH